MICCLIVSLCKMNTGIHTVLHFCFRMRLKFRDWGKILEDRRILRKKARIGGFSYPYSPPSFWSRSSVKVGCSNRSVWVGVGYIWIFWGLNSSPDKDITSYAQLSTLHEIRNKLKLKCFWRKLNLFENSVVEMQLWRCKTIHLRPKKNDFRIESTTITSSTS